MNKEIETLQNQVTNLTLENQKLRKDLEDAVGVIEFYADKSNWKKNLANGTVYRVFNDDDSDDRNDFFTNIYCGHRAREFLKRIDG